jgi:cysteinyl-tRNA synthetase
LEEAAIALDSFRVFSIHDGSDSDPSAEIVAALEDDLNTPRAIAELHRLLGESKRTPGQNPEAARTLFASCKFLGIDVEKVDLNKLSREALAVDGGMVETAIDARNAARKAKDFKKADEIRDELAAKGIQLKDAKDPATGEIVTTWEVKR